MSYMLEIIIFSLFVAIVIISEENIIEKKYTIRFKLQKKIKNKLLYGLIVIFLMPILFSLFNEMILILLSKTIADLFLLKLFLDSIKIGTMVYFLTNIHNFPE